MHLPTLTIDTAPEPSRAVLTALAEQLGTVPNLAATAASSSTLLEAFDVLRRAAATATVEPLHRELFGLATAVAIDNGYGVAFHSTVLSGMGVADEVLSRVRAGRAPADPVLGVVHELAVALAAPRPTVHEDLAARLALEGYTPARILDLLVEHLFVRLVGSVDALAGGVELDEFLQPQAWNAA